nr:MAG: hypothetical protein [Picornaviridae sp.]
MIAMNRLLDYVTSQHRGHSIPAKQLPPTVTRHTPPFFGWNEHVIRNYRASVSLRSWNAWLRKPPNPLQLFTVSRRVRLGLYLLSVTISLFETEYSEPLLLVALPLLLLELILIVVGLLHFCCHNPPTPELEKSSHVRRAFRKLEVPYVKEEYASKNSAHTHPVTAAYRNAANDACNSFITNLGKRVYKIQPASIDIRRGYQHSLTHYWEKDEAAGEEHHDLVEADHIMNLVNVDYYVDWNDYLYLGLPFLIYTFTPRTVAGMHHEYEWCFDEESQVNMVVHGGGRYRHHLWDYDIDHLTAHTPGHSIHYEVERIAHNTHWSFVLFSPASIKPNERTEFSNTLRRISPIYLAPTMDTINAELPDSKIAMLKVVVGTHGADSYMSLGPAAHVPKPVKDLDAKHQIQINGACAVTIPYIMFSALRNKHASTKGGLTDHHLNNIVLPYFRTAVSGAEYHAVSVIATCLPLTRNVTYPATTISVQDTSNTYLNVPKPMDLPPDSYVSRRLHPTVYGHAVVPAKSKGNDRWCIATRIESVANNSKVPSHYSQFVTEFLDFLAAPLVPLDFQEVYERQVKPSQRAKNSAAASFLAWWRDNMSIASFQKNELYGKITDPRNISTTSTEHCYEYSRYTLALADHLKTTNWYAFGQHPDTIAKRVQSLALRHTTFIATDFSRFDGTHSKAFYEIELALLYRCFPTKEHPHLERLHREMLSAKAKTAHGVTYEIGGSRLSGAADTSVMNSVDNALVAYITYRVSGNSKATAWANLGLYGGDDGLSYDVSEEMYNRVSKNLGLRLTAVVRSTVEPTPFLGRIFPSPTTVACSLADLPRQLPRLSITTNKQLSIEDVLINKMRGMHVTDSRTPIIRAWIRLVQRSFPNHEQYKSREELQNYWARFTSASDIIPESILLENAAKQLSCETSLITEYESYLDSLASVTDIDRPIIDMPITIPQGVILGGELGSPFTTTIDSGTPNICPHAENNNNQHHANASHANSRRPHASTTGGSHARAQTEHVHQDHTRLLPAQRQSRSWQTRQTASSQTNSDQRQQSGGVNSLPSTTSFASRNSQSRSSRHSARTQTGESASTTTQTQSRRLPRTERSATATEQSHPASTPHASSSSQQTNSHASRGTPRTDTPTTRPRARVSSTLGTPESRQRPQGTQRSAHSNTSTSSNSPNLPRSRRNQNTQQRQSTRPVVSAQAVP